MTKEQRARFIEFLAARSKLIMGIAQASDSERRDRLNKIGKINDQIQQLYKEAYGKAAC